MDVTMILAMHLPIIGFILLSHFHPGSVFYIYATVIAEQFVTVLVLLLSLYLICSRWRIKTSHYSIATGFMALGMMLPEC
jgi:PAT family beta-lactamase induction signal transducer AmpG